MTDVVERLAARAKKTRESWSDIPIEDSAEYPHYREQDMKDAALLDEAASTIDRLRDEQQKLLTYIKELATEHGELLKKQMDKAMYEGQG